MADTCNSPARLDRAPLAQAATAAHPGTSLQFGQHLSRFASRTRGEALPG
jgi:hypothetical protein